MRYTAILTLLLFVTSTHETARGHGDPILIGASGGKLTVGHRPNNFPALVFGEDDIDGLPNGDVTFLPGPGEIVFWELPGLEINGLDNSSSLSIEPLLRPVAGSQPAAQRLVWYWNPTTDEVAPSPADMHLLGTAPRYVTLPATNTTGVGTFLLANSLAGQQGFHNHGLLSYALRNEPEAPTGVYGFFARFVSNNYAPSDEFLVVFNHGVTFTEVVPAALAIAAAAVDALPGDFNLDGNVDAADYTVWRNENLGPEKYLEWKSHFGLSYGGSGGGPSAAVPEPAAAAMLLISSMVALAICRRLKPFSPAQPPRQTFAETRTNQRV